MTRLTLKLLRYFKDADISVRRRRRRALGTFGKIWLVSMAMGLLVACPNTSGQEGSNARSPAPSRSSLPAPDALLRRSAEAMTQVTSARFLLEFEGNMSGTAVQLRRVEGLANRAGELDATTTLGEPGSEVQWLYRIKGETMFVKVPGLNWVTLPPSQAFNVRRLFDPGVGVGRQLATAKGESTEESQPVNGVAVYRVKATGSPGVLQGMVNLPPGQETVKATLWIAKEGYRLLKAEIHVPTAPTTPDPTVPPGEAVLTLTLSDFDIPVNVEAPVG